MARCLGLSLALLFLPASAAADPNFTIEPFPPTAGEVTTFTAVDAGTTPQWDFNADDVFELDGAAVQHTFASPGLTEVAMKASDGTIVIKKPTVNAPPVAAFGFSPAAPMAGQAVVFTSEASDPDGGGLAHQWDFGDGSFASAQAIDHAFSSPGIKTVRLTVTDDKGAVRSVMREVVVAAEPPALLPATPDLGPRFISPFPVVRLVGEVGAGATLVRLLGVRAPQGSLVRVRCRGADCPTSTMRRRVGASGRVRFRGFERSLEPGTRLAVFVRRGDDVGKYTRFAIRRGKRPRRKDLCLAPGRRAPVSCDENLQG